jgi:hypothetical protein
VRIYVASSWRNTLQPEVVSALRAAGHEVYDFKNPRPGDNGFHWSEIDPAWKGWSPEQFREGLNHPIAQAGFRSDMDALEACDACVLVLPSGRSAHLELGWASGAGKRTLVLATQPEEPELMYLMLNGVCTSIAEVVEHLAAPARDDRGADADTVSFLRRVAPAIPDALNRYRAALNRDDSTEVASARIAVEEAIRSALASGEATALREALDLIRDIETAIYWNDDPAKGMVSGWWSGNPDTAALHARMLRALAAPSQETETRCEHPAAAVTEYRDGHKRCSACAALWYGDENGGWRSEGKEAPAPAPSAATDTGKDGSR